MGCPSSGLGGAVNDGSRSGSRLRRGRHALLERREEFLGELARGRVHQAVADLRDLAAHLGGHRVFEARSCVLHEPHLRFAPREAGDASFAVEAQGVALGRNLIGDRELAAERRAHRAERSAEGHAVVVVVDAFDGLAAGDACAKHVRILQGRPGDGTINGQVAATFEFHL
jgi:hypothetical protein